MDTETLAKEVLNSNLSDDTKICIMKVLFKTEKKEWVPPYSIERIYGQTPDQSISAPTPCEDN